MACESSNYEVRHLETVEASTINTSYECENEDSNLWQEEDYNQGDKEGKHVLTYNGKDLNKTLDDDGLDIPVQPSYWPSSDSFSKKVSERKRVKRMHANLSGTKYTVVHEICLGVGFSIVRETDPNCYFVWNDSFILPERVVQLKPYQRINHFPGMGEICRKDALARHMTKMGKTFPVDYCFVPDAWILPAEFTLFTNYCRDLKKRRKVKTFIVKPANGAMGNGIYLVKNADRLRSNDNVVVQEYIDKPMLLDGYKFDLRVYVLVTNCDPLRIFMYNDGLVPLGTEFYRNPSDENLSDLFMHLTNYSVNKHSENFSRDEDMSKGSKRSLAFLNQWLKRHDYNVSNIWSNIIDIIIKTLIVAQPHVLHSYRLCRPGSNSTNPSVCFEILGFDILLDAKMKPWLLEVNRSPSFGTDSKLDYDIKSGLLRDAIKLLNIKPSDKRRGLAAAKAQSHRRLMMQPKRSGHDLHDDFTKKLILDRRISQLKEQLHRIRHDAAKDDYELRNSGRYRRIYPPRDKQKAKYYLNLLDGAFKVFCSGKTRLVQKEMDQPFKTLKEEEILDLLEQCESDEQAFLENKDPTVKGPKPLSSMPCSRSLAGQQNSTLSEDSSDEDSLIHVSHSGQQLSESQNSSAVAGAWVKSSASTIQGTETHKLSSGSSMRVKSATSSPQLNSDPRHTSATPYAASSRHPKRPASAVHRTATASSKLIRKSILSRSSVMSMRLYPGLQKTTRAEELTRRTLVLLSDMKIKFPGRTEEEASAVLNNVHENWKFHKERVANYWLVTLDSAKRRKVIDIVKTNVRSILQRVWGVSDLDRLRLSRVFTKVFNRMLWSHGQGLWNCFSLFRKSWETMFSKSTDVLTPLEMSCCRRTVSLCKECLLVVYLFAATGGKQMPVETTFGSKSRISPALK